MRAVALGRSDDRGVVGDPGGAPPTDSPDQSTLIPKKESTTSAPTTTAAIVTSRHATLSAIRPTRTTIAMATMTASARPSGYPGTPPSWSGRAAAVDSSPEVMMTSLPGVRTSLWEGRRPVFGGDTTVVVPGGGRNISR